MQLISRGTHKHYTSEEEEIPSSGLKRPPSTKTAELLHGNRAARAASQSRNLKEDTMKQIVNSADSDRDSSQAKREQEQLTSFP